MRAALAILACALLAACAGTGAETSASSGSIEADPTVEVSIRIGPDGPELPEDAVAQLQAYGRRHADEFGGLYVDDQSQGSFVMLFTSNLDEHAAALAQIWPRVTVRGVRFSEAALVELLESLDLNGMAAEGIEPISAGLDTMNNRVTLDVKSDDPTLELRLELEYGGMLEVTVYPIPGPWANVANGPGWRLLAAGQASHLDAYTVRAATDAAEWEPMWESIGLEGEAPAVDFDEEVAVSFGHGIGSGCPEMRLDGVETGVVVFSRTSDPLGPRACTDDLVGSAVFVVAVERSALPDDGFTLQLGEELVTCGADCGTTEQIDVPLP
jgi:hypothetical protein